MTENCNKRLKPNLFNDIKTKYFKYEEDRITFFDTNRNIYIMNANKLTEFNKQLIMYNKPLNEKEFKNNYWENYHFRRLVEWKQRKKEANNKALIDNINFNIEKCNIKYEYFLNGQII